MSYSIIRRLLQVTVLALLVLSCSLTRAATSLLVETPAPMVAPSEPDAQSSEGSPLDEMQDLTDPRAEAALALRSVEVQFEASYPGQDPDRTHVSVDADGNQWIRLTTPLPDGSTVGSENPEWNTAEIFVLDGEAYSRMGMTGPAAPAPDENDAFIQLMYGPNAPVLWLMLVPEDAITETIPESRGGFDTTRYTVEGSLDAGDVWGEFWVDSATGALVGANLSVSESLLHSVESGTPGEVLIYFSVERAEIPAILIP